MTPIRTVITGVSGRMGALLVRLVRDTPEFVLQGGTDKPGSAAIGLDVGLAAHLAPLEVSTVDSLEQSLSRAHVVIDFTTPEVSVVHARLCAEAGVPLVVGSTGFSAEAKEQMAAAAKRIPLVMSPNMSVGVNLVIELAATLARRLGEDFDVEVMEAHHRMKKDAPSGTAMRLADELARALGREHDDIRTSRVGQIGERPAQGDRRAVAARRRRGGRAHRVLLRRRRAGRADAPGDQPRAVRARRAAGREVDHREARRALRHDRRARSEVMARYARLEIDGQAVYAQIEGSTFRVLSGAPWEPGVVAIGEASATVGVKWLPVTAASQGGGHRAELPQARRGDGQDRCPSSR